MTGDEIRLIDALDQSHWWYRGMRESTWLLMVPLLPRHRPLRVLDIGCGTGGNLLHLNALGDVQGLDPNPLCVEHCRRKGVHCVEGSMTDLGSFTASSFDLVTMFDVLNQTDCAEVVAVLTGIRRVLAPGGLLVLREPAMRLASGAHDRAVGIQQRFTRDTIRTALVRAGFEPGRITYLNFLLWPAIVIRRRLGEAIAGRGHTASDLRRTPAFLNALLLGILRAERYLLRFVDLPFGVSVFAGAWKR